jgi:hypothetical protein
MAVTPYYPNAPGLAWRRLRLCGLCESYEILLSPENIGDAHDFMLFSFQAKAVLVRAAFFVAKESFDRIDTINRIIISPPASLEIRNPACPVKLSEHYFTGVILSILTCPVS